MNINNGQIGTYELNATGGVGMASRSSLGDLGNVLTEGHGRVKDDTKDTNCV